MKRPMRIILTFSPLALATMLAMSPDVSRCDNKDRGKEECQDHKPPCGFMRPCRPVNPPK